MQNGNHSHKSKVALHLHAKRLLLPPFRPYCTMLFFFHVMYIVDAAKCLDYLIVGFVFFEFFALDCQLERVHAKPLIDECRVHFHIVYAHAKLSERGHKLRQIVA